MRNLWKELELVSERDLVSKKKPNEAVSRTPNAFWAKLQGYPGAADRWAGLEEFGEAIEKDHQTASRKMKQFFMVDTWNPAAN